jgi:hypothetical protein
MESTHSIKVARWSQWAAGGFVVLLTLLHVMKPELDPAWNFISEYEVGKFGWVMQVAFLLLGCSCMMLVVALWNHMPIVGKIGLLLLFVSAVGMFLGGIFKTDPLNTAIELQTKAGTIHQLGAMLDQIPFAAILITIALFRKKEWEVNGLYLIGMLIFVWFGLIYFVGSVQSQFPEDGKFGPHVLVGWQNRIMITSQALWLMLIAAQARNGMLLSVHTFRMVSSRPAADLHRK